MKLWSPSVRHYSIGNLSIKLIAVLLGFITGFVAAQRTEVFDVVLPRLWFAVSIVNAHHTFLDYFIVEYFVELKNCLQNSLDLEKVEVR